MLKRRSAGQAIEVREVAPGRIVLRGVFEFETARRAHAQGLELIARTSEAQLEVDCGEVTRSDSAALAVLTDWMARARKRGLRLCVLNVPANLRAVALISEVDRLLEQGVDCSA